MTAGYYTWDDDAGAFLTNAQRAAADDAMFGSSRDDGDPGDDQDGGEPIWASAIIDGLTWIESGSPTIEPLWGNEGGIPAARLQPTTIAAASGAGKTTLVQRLALGALGIEGFDILLGWPVAPTAGRVLYLASDRPEQARLSMQRMVTTDEARRVIQQRMQPSRGPPPEDVAADSLLLRDMARHAGATFVIPDSLKDMTVRLSDDAVGSNVNRAYQHLVADGRDVIVPHHVRKVGQVQDKKTRASPSTTSTGRSGCSTGNGSVIYLEAGPVDVELHQLKTPNSVKVSLRFTFSPTGDVAVGEGDPILAAVVASEDAGISTALSPCRLRSREGQRIRGIERVRRRLKVLEAAGMIGDRRPRSHVPLGGDMRTTTVGLRGLRRGVAPTPRRPHVSHETAGHQPHALPHEPHAAFPNEYPCLFLIDGVSWGWSRQHRI